MSEPDRKNADFFASHSAALAAPQPPAKPSHVGGVVEITTAEKEHYEWLKANGDSAATQQWKDKFAFMAQCLDDCAQHCNAVAAPENLTTPDRVLWMRKRIQELANEKAYWHDKYLHSNRRDEAREPKQIRSASEGLEAGGATTLRDEVLRRCVSRLDTVELQINALVRTDDQRQRAIARATHDVRRLKQFTGIDDVRA